MNLQVIPRYIINTLPRPISGSVLMGRGMRETIDKYNTINRILDTNLRHSTSIETDTVIGVGRFTYIHDIIPYISVECLRELLTITWDMVVVRALQNRLTALGEPL